jgi:hydrogenase nickel incorporation protein HypA/HybF
MHEFSLINGLMRKINAIAQEQGARRVVAAKVTLGALSHISADHFRDHFTTATKARSLKTQGWR